MGIRRVPRRSGGHLFCEWPFRARVAQTGRPDEPVTIDYHRDRSGATPAVTFRLVPGTTFVLEMTEGVSAPDLTTGKDLARATLARLATGELTPPEIPYVASTPPERIDVIDHSRLPLRATILRGEDGYEISTIGYVRDGFTLPVAMISRHIDYSWGTLDLLDRLLADTEDEARAAANAELERLANDGIPFYTGEDIPWDDARVRSGNGPAIIALT